MFDSDIVTVKHHENLDYTLGDKVFAREVIQSPTKEDGLEVFSFPRSRLPINYGRSMEEVFSNVVVQENQIEYSMDLSDKPDAEVLVISDLHLHPFNFDEDYLNELIERINLFDVIIDNGDLADLWVGSFYRSPWFERLTTAMDEYIERGGKIVKIFGNHDENKDPSRNAPNDWYKQTWNALQSGDDNSRQKIASLLQKNYRRLGVSDPNIQSRFYSDIMCPIPANVFCHVLKLRVGDKDILIEHGHQKNISPETFGDKYVKDKKKEDALKQKSLNTIMRIAGKRIAENTLACRLSVNMGEIGKRNRAVYEGGGKGNLAINEDIKPHIIEVFGQYDPSGDIGERGYVVITGHTHEEEIDSVIGFVNTGHQISDDPEINTLIGMPNWMNGIRQYHSYVMINKEGLHLCRRENHGYTEYERGLSLRQRMIKAIANMVVSKIYKTGVSIME